MRVYLSRLSLILLFIYAIGLADISLACSWTDASQAAEELEISENERG